MNFSCACTQFFCKLLCRPSASQATAVEAPTAHAAVVSYGPAVVSASQPATAARAGTTGTALGA